MLAVWIACRHDNRFARGTKTVGLVVSQRTTYPGNFRHTGRQGPGVAPPQTATDSGIEVHEEELGTVTAQHIYKMRCECRRSWFELELLKFVECPACHKLSLVST